MQLKNRYFYFGTNPNTKGDKGWIEGYDYRFYLSDTAETICIESFTGGNIIDAPFECLYEMQQALNGSVAEVLRSSIGAPNALS